MLLQDLPYAEACQTVCRTHCVPISFKLTLGYAGIATSRDNQILTLGFLSSQVVMLLVIDFICEKVGSHARDSASRGHPMPIMTHTFSAHPASQSPGCTHLARLPASVHHCLHAISSSLPERSSQAEEVGPAICCSYRQPMDKNMQSSPARRQGS